MSTNALPSPESPRQPQLLRFGLRQMFYMVTLLCVLATLMVRTNGHWPLVIGVATLLVASHVMGNLIGTRLRDTSTEVRHWKSSHPHFGPDNPQAQTGQVVLAELNLPPSTPLANHDRVGGRWLTWFVLGGTLLGACLGGGIILLTIGPRIGWAGWAVATISCAVLGTWLAFLASSFGAIARHAWRHANEEGS